MDWKLNSLIFLCKTLNSAMNIIEMRANTNIHIFQQNENLSKCFAKISVTKFRQIKL